MAFTFARHLVEVVVLFEVVMLVEAVVLVEVAEVNSSNATSSTKTTTATSTTTSTTSTNKTLTAVEREKFANKQEKYFKGKVFTFTVQSLILYQYPVDLLTFLELY